MNVSLIPLLFRPKSIVVGLCLFTVQSGTFHLPHVDLQGWSIEALSPGTTLITLLEQSDPKGWSNKNSIPQQMTAAVAGVGEFVIKCGGPPLMTRLHLDSPHNRYGIEFSRGVCYGTAKPYWRGKVERLWLAVSDVEGFRETVTKLSLVLLN